MEHGSQYSESENEIVDFLIEGRGNVDVNSARTLFSTALSRSESIIGLSKIAHQLYLECLLELADLEYRLPERTVLWGKLVQKCSQFIEEFSEDEETVLHCSDIVILCIQEQFVEFETNVLRRALVRTREKLDSLIVVKGVSNSASLLSKKASILRHLRPFQVTSEAEKNILIQALKCVQKSVTVLDSEWYSHLELGNCYWELLDYEKNVKSFNEKIEMAEAAYLASLNLKITIQNTLTLCRLYRETYQTAPFLLAFQKYESIEKNRRRFLQNSYLIAEVTIRMYYAHFPEELMSEYIMKSDRLLDEALAAGYGDARTIVNLAYLKAINGEVTVGKKVLKALNARSMSTLDWDAIVESLDSIDKSEDLFSKGFVLGIDNAAIWNQLGTFIFNFIGDADLAVRLYRVALRFNPSNPIVLTNLARCLLQTEMTSEVLEDAEYYISKAASFSTFRFQWWRAVKSETVEIRKQFVVENVSPQKPIATKFSLKKIADLHKHYIQLKDSENPQQRGFEFERLINRYFELSLSNAKPSYRSGNQQIDGAFCFEKDHYRLEVKWTKDLIDHTHINDFYFKLQTVGTSGLFISVNGFTDAAIVRARDLKKEIRLLLMDGDEIEATLRGTPTLDEAIRLKQLYFHFEDNPYFRIVRPLKTKGMSY